VCDMQPTTAAFNFRFLSLFVFLLMVFCLVSPMLVNPKNRF